MNAIVSHDVDHLTATEHLFRDMIIPKHLIRTKLEFLSGKISVQEVTERYRELFRNKLNNLETLVDFNRCMQLPNAFFVGFNNGTGLSYSVEKAKACVMQLKERNCKVYLHGILYQSTQQLLQERYKFEKETGLQATGIRMHYARLNEHTLCHMADAGYLFDSTVYDFKNPFKVGRMWEFPFQIMDGWIIENGKRRQTRNLNESKEETKRIIEKAKRAGLTYIGIDFHDRYYSKAFVTWMKWYEWLIDYLKKEEIEFTDFERSMNLLETQQVISSKS